MISFVEIGHKVRLIREMYSKLRPIYLFAINGVALFLIWTIFYELFRYTEFVHNAYEWGTHNLTQFLLVCSEFFLNLFGFETYITGKVVRIVGESGVLLDRGCLGRNLMGLFVGFLLAYPGKLKSKLWYIPLGLVVIQILNIIRIGGLAYVASFYPEYMDINHHFVFKYTVYAIIFLMWMIWIKRINK